MNQVFFFQLSNSIWKKTLRPNNMLVNDTFRTVGKSGGLCLLWKNGVNVTIQNYSRRHINAGVVSEVGGVEWKLTCFYGNPEVTKRKEAWALLRYLSHLSSIPWLCIGNFNEIINLSEQRGLFPKQGVKWRIFREF